MSEPTVLISTTGTVRRLTLNRPAALNSFTAVMHGELLPALLLYLWWWVTVSWSPNPDATFYLALTGVYAVFALLAAPLEGRFGNAFALRVIALCSLGFGICALVSYVGSGALIDDEKGSVRSLFAAFFIAGLPACTYFAMRHASPLAAGIGLFTAIIGFQLGSRTFILLSLPAILGTVMIVGRNWPLLRMARFPLGLLAGIALLAVIGEAAGFSTDSVFQLIGRGTSFQIDQAVFAEVHNSAAAADDLERRLLVVVGLDSFQRNPLFGAGFLSTPFYVGNYYYESLTAHGLPLFLLGETGLVGTAIFLWLVWWVCKGYLRRARQLSQDNATVLYVELLTFLVITANGLFHQVYSDFYYYLFVGLGLWNLHRSRVDPVPTIGPHERAIGLLKVGPGGMVRQRLD